MLAFVGVACIAFDRIGFVAEEADGFEGSDCDALGSFVREIKEAVGVGDSMRAELGGIRIFGDKVVGVVGDSRRAGLGDIGGIGGFGGLGDKVVGVVGVSRRAGLGGIARCEVKTLAPEIMTCMVGFLECSEGRVVAVVSHSARRTG